MATKKKKMPLWKENKINYSMNYNKEKYKNVAIRIPKTGCEEIIEKLESVESKTSYILDLIREDIKRGN